MASQNDTFNSSDVSGFDDYFDIEARAKYFLQQPQTIVALLVGILAITANLMSIMAIAQVRLRLTARFRLIISLCLSDSLVGLTVMLYYVLKILHPVYPLGEGPAGVRLRSRCIEVLTKCLNATGLNMSGLNLFAMAIDHYIAIMKPLHYPSLMSKNRANIMIASFWAAGILAGFSSMIWSAITYHTINDRDKFNYCEIKAMSDYQEEYFVFIITVVCMCVMLFAYVRIYILVRRRQRGIPGEHLKQDFRRNKRALITTLLILVTFALCWFPNMIFQIVMIFIAKFRPDLVFNYIRVLASTDRYLVDLLLLNALCDPIIYTVRMCEVQCGYRRLFRRCCSCIVVLYNKKYDSMFYSTWLDKKAASTDIGAQSEDVPREPEPLVSSEAVGKADRQDKKSRESTRAPNSFFDESL